MRFPSIRSQPTRLSIDGTDGPIHRFLHEVALVARLALGAVKVAMEQSCGCALVLRGYLRHHNKASPLDTLLGRSLQIRAWPRAKGVRTPTVQKPVGQKASVRLGNLANTGKALRVARKAHREDMEQQAEAFQPPMFDF